MILNKDASQYAVRMPLLIDGVAPVATIILQNRDWNKLIWPDIDCDGRELSILNSNVAGSYTITVSAFNGPVGSPVSSECDVNLKVKTFRANGQEEPSGTTTTTISSGTSTTLTVKLEEEDPDKPDRLVRLEVTVQCCTEKNKKCRISYDVTVPTD
jgi:hypothetical protein